MLTADIATVPALPAPGTTGYPASARTGEPRRPVVLWWAIGLAWLSVAVVIANYAAWWWLASAASRFPTSLRLLRWFHPNPVSALTVVLVIAVGIITLLLVAAAGTVAFNAWAGAWWVRVGGLIAIAVQALSFLLSWWYSVAMIPLVASVAILWLPPVRPFLDAMAAKDTPAPVIVPTTHILYGPQPLIGARW